MSHFRCVSSLSKVIFGILSISFLGSVALAHDYIVVSSDGITFPADENGYKIPDFSYAGYKNSNESLPTFGVHYSSVVNVAAPVGNKVVNQTNIQNAIDAVEALPLNEYGYRGAVVFGAGTWNVVDSGYALRVEESGVVLRGAGMDATIIQDYDNNTPTVIQIGPHPTNTPKEMFDEGRDGTKWDIVSDVVHVGDMSFVVESGHGLRVGDEIIIEHPCTAEWIKAVSNGGVTEDAPWSVGGVPIRYWRTVMAVTGDRITVDVPVFYSLVRSISQCFVYKYTGTYVENCGMENLTVDVDHNGISTLDIAPFNGIQFNNTKNCWIRGVRALNFRASGIAFNESRNFTVSACESIDPHSIVDSARRYNFNIRGGQNGLYRDCYARRGRHSYVTNGHGMDSGNVYINCVSEDPYNASEHGHQRWSHGSLWENCTFQIVGKPESPYIFDDKMLWLGNHGDNSNGHGWASATAVAYKSTVIPPGYGIVAKPPTAMSYEIDCVGDWRSSHFAHGDFPGAIDISTSGRLPDSLFEAQYLQRGKDGGWPVPDWESNHELIDFGKQVTGNYVSAEIVLTNTSGDVISGEVVEDSDHYSIESGAIISGLPDGETHTVTLEYAPTTAEQHDAIVTVTGGDGLTIPVTGFAYKLQEALSFPADVGHLVDPMIDGGSHIETTVRDEGEAIYAVNIEIPGTYKVDVSVNAPISGSNSFFVSFDAFPSSNEDIWDVLPLTNGFESREITARGPTGTFEDPQYSPATWFLSSGVHYLMIRGREAGTQLRAISITLVEYENPPPIAPSGLEAKRLD
ncbi:hypothetical protein [Pelagicoccus mobilis]|uniref:Uncharacterized protein n=1 Tax=Pelagicoccus mobilis TaxID=415221 RepID=A0A934RWS5_9BACT|nr:hypothetical protein [Pelagicoccus mobilis]MBK1877946.1 hypothetical protein [Pelagicoccus mobilis]